MLLRILYPVLGYKKFNPVCQIPIGFHADLDQYPAYHLIAYKDPDTALGLPSY